MRVILNVSDGPAKGKFFLLEQGTVKVGRGGDFPISEDSFLSRSHFELAIEGDKALVRDLGSNNGTLHNGHPLRVVELEDGDELAAGNSVFQIGLEMSDDVPGSMDSPAAQEKDMQKLDAVQLGLWRVLHHVKPPLYTLVDTAIGELARDYIALCGMPRKSLYEGEKAVELERFAPYLVELQPKSEALRKVIADGWGKNWGVYFASPLSFIETRRHLRKFLLVRMPDGKVNYFRYYDPRVLRDFLPQCSPEELVNFFGPVTQFLMADGSGQKLLRFTQANGVLKTMEIELSKQAAPGKEEGK